MNEREKKLALIVAVLLAVTVCFFTWSALSNTFRTRRSTLIALEGQIQTKETTQKRGQRAAERIREYEARSLPPNPEVAQSRYQTWLFNLIDDVGFAEVAVDPLVRRAQRDVYWQLAFRIGGKGDLDQVTEFLHRFYSANHLHRIGQLVLRPVGDTKELTVDAQIQALVLPGSQNTETLSTAPASRLALGGLPEYVQAIVRRNVLGSANLPPRLERIGRQEAAQGEDLRVGIKASDPDKSGKLSYRLADGAPKGAEIDATSGEFRWKPDELGSYDVTVEVSDGGMPEQVATEKFTIEVSMPREKVAEPSADAQLTYVTAVTDGQQRLVWLLHRSSGKRFRLEEGDEFEAGELRGKVVKIGSRDAQLVLGDRILRVGLGQNVSEGTEVTDESL